MTRHLEANFTLFHATAGCSAASQWSGENIANACTIAIAKRGVEAVSIYRRAIYSNQRQYCKHVCMGPMPSVD